MKQWTRHCVSTSFFPPFSKKMLSKKERPSLGQERSSFIMTENLLQIPSSQKNVSRMWLGSRRLRWQDCELMDCIFSSFPDVLTVSFRPIQVVIYLATTNMLIMIMVNTNWCTPFIFSLSSGKMGTAMWLGFQQKQSSLFHYSLTD